MNEKEQVAAVSGYDLACEDLELLLWLHAEAVWTVSERDGALRAATDSNGLRRLYDVMAAELERSEASRQAWAEEAMRLDTAFDVIAAHCEELSAKADTKIGEVAGADLAWAACPLWKETWPYEREGTGCCGVGL